MRIKLINCDAKLKAMGINMEDVGAYDHLCVELSKKLIFTCVEYDFPPLDYILIDIEEGTEIPNLSDFGEVSE